MKKIIQYSLTTFIFLLIWIVWQESFSYIQLTVGFLVSLITLLTVNWLFRKINIDFDYLSVNNSVYYVFHMIKIVFISGISTIKKGITGQTNIGIYQFKTGIKSDFKKTILSNSITLSPGTVTIDFDDTSLFILCIDIAEFKSSGVRDVRKLEKLLMKG
jgi:multicomponent Na+:H+ antiporter subunit E